MYSRFFEATGLSTYLPVYDGAFGSSIFSVYVLNIAKGNDKMDVEGRDYGRAALIIPTLQIVLK